MNIILRELISSQLPAFKKEMQESFQKSYEAQYGPDQKLVLPECDIDSSLQNKNAMAYEAVADEQRVGGTIVNINRQTHHCNLDFLYVKVEYQNHNFGKTIWETLEKQYPDTHIWETFTPYFDQRNIHFYVNLCGFHIVEFFNQRHLDPNIPENFTEEDGMFRFEKLIKNKM